MISMSANDATKFGKRLQRLRTYESKLKAKNKEIFRS